MKIKLLIIFTTVITISCNSQNENQTIRFEQKEGYSEIEIGANDSPSNISFSKDSSLLLPIIRNYTLDTKDIFEEIALNKKLSENLGIFIARVNVKENGNTGIDYVLKKDIEAYNKTEKDLFITAIGNIENAKMHVKGMVDEVSKDELVIIESQIGLSTCILVDFSFLESIAQKLKVKKLAIVIINSGMVLISKPESSFKRKFEKIALESKYTDVVNIHSALYSWEIGSTEFKMIKKYKE